MNDRDLIDRLVSRIEALESFVFRESDHSFEDEIIEKETKRLGLSEDQYLQVKNERGGTINFRAPTLGRVVCSVSLKTKDKTAARFIRNNIILALGDAPKNIDAGKVKAVSKGVVESHYTPAKDVF